MKSARVKTRPPAIPADMHPSPSVFSLSSEHGSARFLWWLLPFLAALLPIILLSLYSYKTASESVQSAVAYGNDTAALNLSTTMVEHILQTTDLAHAVASIPGTVEAVKQNNEEAITTRLRAIVASYPQIQRAFVTDRRGVMWSDYPPAPGMYGKNLYAYDWYRGVSRTWTPYVSGVYENPLPDRPPVFAVAVPIRNDSQEVIGILVFESNVKQMIKWLQGIRLPRGGGLYIVDHTGRLAAHPTVEHKQFLQHSFKSTTPIQQALGGTFLSEETEDPISGLPVVATFLPVSIGNQPWVIVAAQSTKEAYAPLQGVKWKISIAGGALTLVTLLTVIFLALLNAKVARLNLVLKEMASIVASSNDAIIGLTPDGMIRNWNAGAEAIFGYAATEARGSPFSLLAVSGKPDPVPALLKRAERGQHIKHVDIVRRKKDGKSIDISLTISPVWNEQGQIIGTSAIARDITERKLLEQMRNDFVSMVSHQLRAPVTAIKWMLENLLEGNDGTMSHGVRKVLTVMDQVNHKNEKLIADILNLSRIERGVIAVGMTPVAISDIMQSAVRDYKAPMAKAGLKLLFEEQEKGIIVMADEDKSIEAVSNSVSNAIKHTQKGSITLRARREGDMAFIDVIDTGEGMSKDMLKKLFTRDKVVGANADPGQSTGLGLYIAKIFMQMQRGDILVTSTPGKGTTFSYRFHIAREEDIEAAKEVVQKSQISSSSKKKRKK